MESNRLLELRYSLGVNVSGKQRLERDSIDLKMDVEWSWVHY
jgi:hypothetical protein